MELVGAFLNIMNQLKVVTNVLTLHAKSYVLPTECVCFVWISEQTVIISLYRVNL
jgi:hypothetical protein